MSSRSRFLPFVALMLGAASVSSAAPTPRDYPVQPVPFTSVHLNDVFWAPRIETNRSVTIPFAFRQCEESGRVYNFEAAAAALAGHPYAEVKMPGFPFDDTDIYKVIEGAAYTLSVRRDADLEAYVDKLVEKIAAAQEPDGYLYTARTMRPAQPHPWAGPERWIAEEKGSHELYNLGHLYEAAVAYYQATGKRALFDVAIKSADLLDRSFGPGKRAIWPGHQIVEMGLAKLYRVTGEERYLALAKFMLDVRGRDPKEPGSPYSQSHMPVVEQKKAVGHAVRAGYMYAGMADVAALTGDQAYVAASDRIWSDVVGRRLYLTGGIGARHEGEAFGDAYELPNLSAYNETCAAIANVYWNERLFLFRGDARYVDVLERTLYNGVLSGVSLDGKAFFYPNPLASKGDYRRQPWFGCACCPGNMTRFLASVSGYQYARAGSDVYVNLYAAGECSLETPDAGRLKLVQETRYPWEGEVLLRVEPEKSSDFALFIRIPGWARGEVVPSDLYRFADGGAPEPSLSVNGQAVPLTVEKGYVAVRRSWKSGDELKLTLPMPVRAVVANEKVADDRGLIAFERGPLVYCFEGVDNQGLDLNANGLPPVAEAKTAFEKDLLGGVVTLRLGKLTAIPYYAWANRGPSPMTVWHLR